jgi:DNA invertase Pin-like site-specific DNA recombinase
VLLPKCTAVDRGSPPAPRRSKVPAVQKKVHPGGRSASLGTQPPHALMDAGVDFVACDQPFALRLTLHILAAVAEDEARRISERTRTALAAAKARSTKLGTAGNAETAAKARAARTARRAKANASTKVVVEDIRRSDVETLVGIAKVLEARGVRTTAGRSAWQPVQVSRLLAV